MIYRLELNLERILIGLDCDWMLLGMDPGLKENLKWDLRSYL